MVNIGIINLGISNISSIQNALNDFGAHTTLISAASANEFDAIVLPGVGNFRYAMDKLNSKDLIVWLNKKILTQRIPLLGICLGMQLLADEGEEGGNTRGLGYIPGKVIKLNNPNIRIPHQGWDDITILQPTPLFEGLSAEPSFYFVHSYFFDALPETVSSKCNYGSPFPSSVQKDNILGVQFHPEKSQKNGEIVLKNFYNLLRR